MECWCVTIVRLRNDRPSVQSELFAHVKCVPDVQLSTHRCTRLHWRLRPLHSIPSVKCARSTLWLRHGKQGTCLSEHGCNLCLERSTSRADVDILPGLWLRAERTPAVSFQTFLTFVSGTRECLKQDWLNPIRVESPALEAERGVAVALHSMRRVDC